MQVVGPPAGGIREFQGDTSLAAHGSLGDSFFKRAPRIHASPDRFRVAEGYPGRMMKGGRRIWWKPPRSASTPGHIWPKSA